MEAIHSQIGDPIYFHTTTLNTALETISIKQKKNISSIKI